MYTRLSRKLPLAVRTLPGTDVPGLGYNVGHTRALQANSPLLLENLSSPQAVAPASFPAAKMSPALFPDTSLIHPVTPEALGKTTRPSPGQNHTIVMPLSAIRFRGLK